MNTIEIVKLNSDTNYIPVKYAVIEIGVGSALGSTYALLKCIQYGVDTEAHFNTFKANTIASNEIDKTVLAGTLNTYSVVAFSGLSPYSAPNSVSFGPYILG